MQPHRPILWRGDHEIQVGHAPRPDHVISGLETPEVAALLNVSFVERAGRSAFRGPLDERDLPLPKTTERLTEAAARIRGLWAPDLPDVPLGATGILEANEEPLTRAVAAQLRRYLSLTRPPSAQESAPQSLTVLANWYVTDPTVARGLLHSDSLALPLVMDDDGVTCGPLVVPGVTACTWCLELARTDADPAWPQLAPQLAARRPRPLSESLTEVVAGLAPTLLMLAAAGVVQGWRVERDVVAAFECSPHPSCGCGGTFD